jgi:hypothetical protein
MLALNVSIHVFCWDFSLTDNVNIIFGPHRFTSRGSCRVLCCALFQVQVEPLAFRLACWVASLHE